MMKISGIQNNYQSFGRLILDRNIRQSDMKKIIRPCLDSIKGLASEYDINLKSGSVLKKSKHFVSPRPAIEITITPKDETDAYLSSNKLVMPIKDYETDSETLFDVIKSTIRNVF